MHCDQTYKTELIIMNKAKFMQDSTLLCDTVAKDCGCYTSLSKYCKLPSNCVTLVTFVVLRVRIDYKTNK